MPARTVGVAITTSAVRAVSAMSLPRITSVPPWARQPRISQAAMSKAMLRSWATRSPGRMPRPPGSVSRRLETLRWVTFTPLGLPVVPEVNRT